MTPSERVARAMAMVLRNFDNEVSDVELIALTSQMLELGLAQLDRMVDHPDYRAQSAVEKVRFREALALLAEGPAPFVAVARARQVTTRGHHILKRGQEAMVALRHMPVDAVVRELLDGLGYRGLVPSMAYALAVQEILMAGGTVEGPNPKLSEPR
jgi:hypothetical protein